jgi:hypothetical protein
MCADKTEMPVFRVESISLEELRSTALLPWDIVQRRILPGPLGLVVAVVAVAVEEMVSSGARLSLIQVERVNTFLDDDVFFETANIVQFVAPAPFQFPLMEVDPAPLSPTQRTNSLWSPTDWKTGFFEIPDVEPTPTPMQPRPSQTSRGITSLRCRNLMVLRIRSRYQCR